MVEKRFKALWVTETADGGFVQRIEERPLSVLPEGNVLVRVKYSALNYKDALSATGNRGVTRTYPHIPGVDAAGVVEESSSSDFVVGQEVLITGYELGANAFGGWSEFVRVPADWIVPMPEGLTLRESMILGSAGYTAGLAAHQLLNRGIRPDQGPVLVIGATGGVGSMAVALLSLLGFTVEAATGKLHEAEFLQSIGASTLVSREEILGAGTKPLLKGRWAAVVDTVGGSLLDAALRQTKLEGAVACCGNIGSAELHTSIYPFILRGIALLGVGSAFTPMPVRRIVWKQLAGPWKLGNLEAFAVDGSLEDLINTHIGRILKGKVRGRVVVTL
jgi:putative YhdH/YhfP family quinone oxidoreductase